MLEKGKISSIATVLMLMNVVGATAVVFLPAVTATYAKQDAWMSSVIATFHGILVIFLVTNLERRFPGKTIFEYLQIVLGKWFGKGIGILYLFFFIHTNGIIIREFSELLANFTMPHTPILVFHVTFILLAAYAIRSGLEVTARLQELVIPWAFFLFIGILLFGLLLKPEFNRLFPMLENGIKPVLLGSITPSAWRGEIVLLSILLPYLAEPRKGRTLGIWAVIALGVFLTFDAIVNTIVFGPDVPRLVFPTFTIANELLHVGITDIALTIAWLAGIVGKISIFYYVAVLGTAQLLSLKDYTPLVSPIGVILVAVSILSVRNSVELSAYFTIGGGFPPFAFLFESIIPLVLLLIATIRGFKPKY